MASSDFEYAAYQRQLNYYNSLVAEKGTIPFYRVIYRGRLERSIRLAWRRAEKQWTNYVTVLDEEVREGR